jgi:hypothetical protein
MSNIIQPNPGIIDLREDNSVWSSPVNYDISGYKGSENPAVQARAEYENDLYVNAISSDTYDKDPESVAVETAQPLSPVREGGAQVGGAERVPGQGEMYAYATNDGRAIDPAHAEAALSAVHDVFAAGEQPAPQEAQTAHELVTYASRLADRLGEGLTIVRQNADTKWRSNEGN